MWVALKRASCRVVAFVNCACVPQFFQQLINTNFFQEIRLSISLLCTSSNTNFLSKSCFRRWIPCCLLTNAAITSAVTNFWCHKLITIENKKENSDSEGCGRSPAGNAPLHLFPDALSSSNSVSCHFWSRPRFGGKAEVWGNCPLPKRRTAPG